VGGVELGEVGGVCTVILHSGRRFSADLVVGADGINSVMRECLVGHPGKPTPTEGFGVQVVAPDEGYDIGSRVEGVRDRSGGQLLDRTRCACWYFPFGSCLKGANEV